MKRYNTLKTHILDAYKVFGGFKELVLSPFFQISVVLGLLTLSGTQGSSWNSWVLSVTPSILGFTLAGYTIFISSLSSSITRALVKATDKNSGGYSYYRIINVTFFHFIFIQAVSIAYALVHPSLTNISAPQILEKYLGLPAVLSNLMDEAGFFVLGLAGTVLLFYSVSLIVAVLVWIFRVIKLVEAAEVQAIMQEQEEADTREKQKEPVSDPT